MATQYYCKNEKRRELVDQHQTLNGLDYLEVLDRRAPAGVPRQINLLVRFLKSVPALQDIEVEIKGGVRVTPVKVLWFHKASEFSPNPAYDSVPPNTLVTKKERILFSLLPNPDQVLVVRTDSNGDYSKYTLQVLIAESCVNPPALDPQLSELEFSFKVECPSRFDCKEDRVCPAPSYPQPRIDYLAKDYASFRRLMLDRISLLIPGWQERSPADLQVALVELLAYVGDRLSYFQDAVATEAYLNTARKRVSLRRHARLVDYTLHEGCNARAWVFLEVKPGGNADGATLEPGAILLSQCPEQKPVVPLAGLDKILTQNKPLVFETLTKVNLHSAHNQIYFHTWSDTECCLPAGATRATLLDNPTLSINKGDLLLFEEVKSPVAGEKQDSDPMHRHVVRLTEVENKIDMLSGESVVDIEWSAEDALPFPFCLSTEREKAGSVTPIANVSVARGNVVLADHGRTVYQDLDKKKIKQREVDPIYLSQGPVTHSDKIKMSGSATSAFRRELQKCYPAILLIEDPSGEKNEWYPQFDLLNSDKFSEEFVLESETNGLASIRFGNGINGKQPAADHDFQAVYRIGNGREGNIGTGAIAHVVPDLASGITDILSVRNPLPSEGGVDPESMEEVRQFAPQAFRTQKRAVTEQDYADRAMELPGIQKAVAFFRWTGSWYTVFLVIDREKGRSVEQDKEFVLKLQKHMEEFRMAGFDLEIEDPVLVPLDISMEVCVKEDYFKSDVEQHLLKVFCNYEWMPGKKGFFHPDNYTFGQSVYLSQIYDTATKVQGVASVKVTRFHCWGKEENQEVELGYLKPGDIEIICLDNDSNFPEKGKIEFVMMGGM